MALRIVKMYLGLPFSANRRCLRSVCLRSVCRGQLSWTLVSLLSNSKFLVEKLNLKLSFGTFKNLT